MTKTSEQTATGPVACPDCADSEHGPGLDGNADECATCGGDGELPAAVVAKLAADRADEAAFDAVARADDGAAGSRSEVTDRDVTLTRVDGTSATFGPMPAGDAALVSVIALVNGYDATVRPSAR